MRAKIQPVRVCFFALLFDVTQRSSLTQERGRSSLFHTAALTNSREEKILNTTYCDAKKNMPDSLKNGTDCSVKANIETGGLLYTIIRVEEKFPKDAR